MRLIDADALANYANNQIVGITANDIMRFPTVDAEPVKHGEWIGFPERLEYENAFCDEHIVCSECHHVWNVIDNCTEEFKYCPNCGARMDGD
jgi:hypothetical protein